MVLLDLARLAMTACRLFAIASPASVSLLGLYGPQLMHLDCSLPCSHFVIIGIKGCVYQAPKMLSFHYCSLLVYIKLT